MNTLTHKGWFGLCPVYFGGLDTAGPLVVERSRWFVPLMVLSEWFFTLCFFVVALGNPEFEASWPLRITGRLRSPLCVDGRGVVRPLGGG